MRIVTVAIALLLVASLAGCRTPLTYHDFQHVGEGDPSEAAYLKADAICRAEAHRSAGDPPLTFRSFYFACMAEKGWVRAPESPQEPDPYGKCEAISAIEGASCFITRRESPIPEHRNLRLGLFFDTEVFNYSDETSELFWLALGDFCKAATQVGEQDTADVVYTVGVNEPKKVLRETCVGIFPEWYGPPGTEPGDWPFGDEKEPKTFRWSKVDPERGGELAHDYETCKLRAGEIGEANSEQRLRHIDVLFWCMEERGWDRVPHE
jgi:hypothetical protein